MSELPVPSNAGSWEGQEEPWEEMRWHLQGIVGETLFLGRFGSGNMPGNAFVMDDKISSACKKDFSLKRSSCTTRCIGQRDQEPFHAAGASQPELFLDLSQ